MINLGGSPVDVSVDLSAIGLKGGKATSARDIWAGKDVGSVRPTLPCNQLHLLIPAR